MKLMRCPLNGLRNIQEFSCGGEVLAPPGEQSRDAGAWAGYLFMHDNPAGVVREWWYHVPTSYWFIAERDTVTDEIVATYPASRLFPGDGDSTRTGDGGAAR